MAARWQQHQIQWKLTEDGRQQKLCINLFPPNNTVCMFTVYYAWFVTLHLHRVSLRPLNEYILHVFLKQNT